MRTRAVVLIVLAILLLPLTAGSAEAGGLIRDAEIENTIRAYTTPLFRAAGLNPEDIHIYIINDDQINSFVADGMNVFIYTGLLLAAKNPNEIIGVLAHETGHIMGGHLARMANKSETSSAEATVATILGIVTAIATGSGAAGTAITQTGQGIALGSLLSYSRIQEGSADETAFELLDKTHQSAKGFADFLKFLEDRELVSTSHQDPYTMTHPLTRDRVERAEHHVATSPYSNAKPNPEFVKMYNRMEAKLHGFIDPPGVTLNHYKADDKSVPARYARAIAYYRLADLDHALPLVDGLIAQEPDNPYFRELKGQMLFENGRIAESLPPYRKAVALDPGSALLRIGLAQSQLETNDKALVDKALQNLLKAVETERHNAFAWDLLAVAYGRSGKYGESALSSAEAAMARGNPREGLDQAKRAEKRLKKGSAAWLRMEDIKHSAQEALAKKADQE